MNFEYLEIRTNELIVKFNDIEKRKRAILRRLESRNSPVFNELKGLSILLNEEEIPLLKIILGELDFLEERKRVLSRLAIRRGHDDFFWKILNRIDDLRKAVKLFLKQAEEDAARVKEIERRWEHSTEGGDIQKLIEELINSLRRNIKLEERLEEHEII